MADEIKRVLMERPEILVEVLTAKPEIVYEALARLMPWQNLATKDDLKKLEEKMATKEELRRVEASLRDDLRRVELALNALGARWGILNEDAFRSGVRELLRDAGYTVDRWVHYDDKGYVYGYPSEVELDIIRDGRTLAVEITSALKRGDLQQIRRKVELFSTVTGRRVDAVYVITPFIHDRNPDAVAAVASSMGIVVVWPKP